MSNMAEPTSLYLAPIDPFADTSPPLVLEVLRDLDIVAAPMGTSEFYAGDGFSRHVVFAGCSPYLVMQPPEDGSRRFCHVAIHGPFEQPHLITGPNTVKPRCPQCRKRFDDWRAQLADWLSGEQQVTCPHCGATHSVHTIDWREHAVSGRYLVELRNVFPGEATPSDELMHKLSEAAGQTWCYAWAAYLDT